jgi:hypothetical protein
MKTRRSDLDLGAPGPVAPQERHLLDPTSPDRGVADPPRRSPGSRLVAAATALLLLSAVATATWRTFGEGADRVRDPAPAPADPSPFDPSPAAADPWAGFGVGWTELPAPPEPRSRPSVAWTGAELVLWGGVPAGADTEAADGYAFDPAAGTWRTIPAAPVTPTGPSRSVWTGSEVVFHPANVAFDPVTNAWRQLPASPHDPRYRETAVAWTGSEVIVFGGGDRGTASARRGAAYDPSADRWRAIAEAPIGLNLSSAAWTGDEVVVFGSLLNDRNVAETATSVGAAYDPAADAWRVLPPSDLSPQATSAVWVGGRLVAWDYEVHAQTYDPAADAWSEPTPLPMEFSECYPDSVVAGDVVFAWFCGQAAAYDAADDRWRPVDGGPLDPVIRAGGREHPLFQIAAIVGAGDAIVAIAEGVTLDEEGVVCFGCGGAPLSSWVYRPSA